MRDVFVTAVILGSIPFILRRPYIGILMWVWVSVMSPHRLTWNWAFDLPFAALIAGVTLVAIFASKDRRAPPVNGLTVALFMFVAWTGVTTLFAFYPEANQIWITMMKTQLMAFLIPVIFHHKDHLRQLIWIIVLSIAFYGTKGGLWVLMTGGGERVWGPAGSYIEDNNALAVATVMIIPLLRYLQLTSPNKHVRWGLTGMMLLCGLSAIGSHSRGAFIAATAMALFMLWKTKHKFQVLLVAVLAIPAAISFMPDNWSSRIDTIANYEVEDSAQMRFNSWGTMFNIAKDRPLVGGGFEVATREVYDRYAPDPRYPPQTAHSIYFQAMGEHGFVGFALYLLLYFTAWRHAGALTRITRGRADLGWAHNFGLMLQVSLVGFAVGGAFLSLILYDVPYYLLGVLLVMRVLVDKELGAKVSASAPISRAGAFARR